MLVIQRHPLGLQQRQRLRAWEGSWQLQHSSAEQGRTFERAAQYYLSSESLAFEKRRLLARSL